MSRTADVVVIGGGIIGCACAYFLQREGRRVVLLERDAIASGTASSSGGWVVVQDKETAAGVRLAAESRRLYDALAADAGVILTRTGGLILAETPAQRDALARQQQIAAAGGVRSVLLDGPGLRAAEPSLAPDLAGGLLAEEEAVVDPPQVCRALAARVRALGGRIREGTPVEGMELRGDGVITVRTPSAEIGAPAVVCAAGVWSPRIGAMVQVSIPVRPRRGHLAFLPEPLVLRPMLEAAYRSATGTGATNDEGSGIRFVAQPLAGGLVVGSSREFRGEDQRPDQSVVRRMWARAARFIPALTGQVPARVTVGLRPFTGRGRPIIGRAGPEGFIIATGHEGEGITLAPVTGRLVADLVAGRITRTGFELDG